MLVTRCIYWLRGPATVNTDGAVRGGRLIFSVVPASLPMWSVANSAFRASQRKAGPLERISFHAHDMIRNGAVGG